MASGSLTSSALLTIVRVLKYLKNQTSNAVSFSGQLLKRFHKTYSGIVSFNAAVSYAKTGGIGAYSYIAAGIQSLSGAITRNFIRAYEKSGVLSIAGVVTNRAARIRTVSFAGAVSIVRVLKYLKNQTSNILTFSGSASPYVGTGAPGSGWLNIVGAISRRIGRLSRTLAGTLTLTGTTIGQKWGYGAFTKTVSGVVSFVGAITDVILTTNYSVTKSRAISFVGRISKKKSYFKSLSGIISPLKFLTFQVENFSTVVRYRTYAGALSFAGTIKKAFLKTVSGAVTSSGALLRTIAITRVYSGAVNLSGSAYGWLTGTARLWWYSAYGAVSFAGSTVAGFVVTHVYAGAVSLVGLADGVFLKTRSKSGTLNITGRCYPDKVIEILYYGVPNP